MGTEGDAVRDPRGGAQVTVSSTMLARADDPRGTLFGHVRDVSRYCVGTPSEMTRSSEARAAEHAAELSNDFTGHLVDMLLTSFLLVVAVVVVLRDS